MFKIDLRINLNLIWILIMFANSSLAIPAYYRNHQEGWYWYQNPVINKQQILINRDPVKVMEDLHRQVNYALDKAILDPSAENVRNYMEMQNMVSRKSTAFSATWQKVLLENPELDYSLTHPATSLGRQVYLNQYNQKLAADILNFANKYGLFFFYKADCSYCEAMAPILKSFINKYKISMIPISTSAEFLAEFPESQIDNGQALTLKINTFPALFAVEPKSQKIIPISYGFMSEDLLVERIAKIMHDFRDDI